MKGLWVAAGSCSGWLGTDSPPSSKRALNEACPRAQLPREQRHGPHPGGFGLTPSGGPGWDGREKGW